MSTSAGERNPVSLKKHSSATVRGGPIFAPTTRLEAYGYVQPFRPPSTYENDLAAQPKRYAFESVRDMGFISRKLLAKTMSTGDEWIWSRLGERKGVLGPQGTSAAAEDLRQREYLF